MSVQHDVKSKTVSISNELTFGGFFQRDPGINAELLLLGCVFFYYFFFIEIMKKLFTKINCMYF